MDFTNILLTLIGAVGGTAIWQFLSYNKQIRKIESETKKSEEEAKKSAEETKQAGFTNYKEQLDYFFTINGKLVEDSMNVREDNFNLKQKIKEYEYRFSDYDRKIQGMQRTIEENIKRCNILSSELAEFKTRATFAEEKICLNFECEKRRPTIGTFKIMKNENK